MMLSESDSDSDSDAGAMTGQITEKDPYDERQDKCKCTGGCKTRSCPCVKFGSGCKASCECTASCDNIFNKLDYFFGENHKCDANACFAQWLMKNGDFTKVNRDELRDRIDNCGM